MGLLSKAINIDNAKKDENQKGLLEKADFFLKKDQDQGIFEKMGEGRKTGLLKKAESIYMGEERKKGLLEQAEKIKKGEEGFLARAEKIKEEEEIEEQPQEVEKVTLELEEQPQEVEKVPPELEEKPREAEKVLVEEEQEVLSEEEGKKFPPGDAEKCLLYLKEKNVLKLLKMFDAILKQKGYERLLNLILEVFTSVEKGKSGALYILLKGRFRTKIRFSEQGNGFELSEKGYKKTSPLVSFLGRESEHPLRYDKIKDEVLKKDTEDFNPLSPWTIIPFTSEGELFGFAFVGKRSKRGGPAELLMLFSYICSPYIAGYSVKELYIQQLARLEKNIEEKDFLLDLYLPSEFPGSMEQAFENFCKRLEIKCAVALTGWGKNQKVLASEGLSEEVLKRYKLPATDRTVKSIIKNGLPDIPPDFENRNSKLFKNQKDKVSSYIILPVDFLGQLLSVIVIHQMKGAGKKLTASLKEKLRHGARSLVPYFLYSDIHQV